MKCFLLEVKFRACALWWCMRSTTFLFHIERLFYYKGRILLKQSGSQLNYRYKLLEKGSAFLNAPSLKLTPLKKKKKAVSTGHYVKTLHLLLGFQRSREQNLSLPINLISQIVQNSFLIWKMRVLRVPNYEVLLRINCVDIYKNTTISLFFSFPGQGHSNTPLQIWIIFIFRLV